MASHGLVQCSDFPADLATSCWSARYNNAIRLCIDASFAAAAACVVDVALPWRVFWPGTLQVQVAVASM